MISAKTFMLDTIWVAIGGAVGAVARFWLTEFVHLYFEKGFPWGTLVVNIIGSFLMGFLTIYLFRRIEFAEQLRSLLLIGVLGAFTTFSTFSLDTLNLLAQGKIALGIANVLSSVILCLLMAGIGVYLAEFIA